jgi:anti-sigma factor RsiW
MLLDARYGSTERELGQDVNEHIAQCDACSAYAADAARLDSVLASEVDEEPRPGFDTRFRARLEESKKPRRRFSWRGLLAGSATAAAAAAAVLWLTTADRVAPMAQDLELAMNLEMLEQYELVRALDEVEVYGLLGSVDPSVLEAMIAQEDGR